MAAISQQWCKNILVYSKENGGAEGDEKQII